MTTPARPSPLPGIPAVQGLALLVTAACSQDPAIGSWEGRTFLDYSGSQIALPYTVDYVYNGYDYTYRLEVFLTMDSRGLGYLDLYTATFSGGRLIYGGTYAYDLFADRVRRGHWLVDIPDYFRLELDCVADRSLMNCIGRDIDGYDYDMDFVPYF